MPLKAGKQLAHESQKVGLASAMAVVLLVIILIATMLQKVFFRYCTLLEI